MANKYNMNVIQEFKSHSSWLYNERMAILFYLLDMDSVALNIEPTNVNLLKKVKAYNGQIYKNIRMVIRSDPIMRGVLNLNTKDAGTYVTDLQFNTIETMIRWCEANDAYTPRKCFILVSELNSFEMSIKDIMQYYSYFIRSGIKQKPDVLVATQKYKEMADAMTVEQLREVVGKNHKIDFDNIALITDENKDDDDFEDSDDDEDLVLDDEEE